MLPFFKKWMILTGQKVHWKAFGFIFIFSSFFPEMVWRLHRKRNKGRRKSGFVFSYISFMEVAAPQFSADLLSIYTKVAEQCGKLFGQKLLLGPCEAAPLSRSSCITFHHANPSDFPWSPTSISDTLYSWERRQWNEAAIEAARDSLRVWEPEWSRAPAERLGGSPPNVTAHYLVLRRCMAQACGALVDSTLWSYSYMSCFYCRQLYHLLSQGAFCLTFLKSARDPGIS